MTSVLRITAPPIRANTSGPGEEHEPAGDLAERFVELVDPRLLAGCGHLGDRRVQREPHQARVENDSRQDRLDHEQVDEDPDYRGGLTPDQGADPDPQSRHQPPGRGHPGEQLEELPKAQVERQVPGGKDRRFDRQAHHLHQQADRGADRRCRDQLRREQTRAVGLDQQGRGDAAVPVLGGDREDAEHQREEEDERGVERGVDRRRGRARVRELGEEGAEGGDQHRQAHRDADQHDEAARRAQLHDLAVDQRAHSSPEVSSRKTSSSERATGESSEMTRPDPATTRPISSPESPLTTNAPSVAGSTDAPASPASPPGARHRGPRFSCRRPCRPSARRSGPARRCGRG